MCRAYGFILMRAGETDAALAEIERLLAGPSTTTVHMLRLDPRWDPIREEPALPGAAGEVRRPDYPPMSESRAFRMRATITLAILIPSLLAAPVPAAHAQGPSRALVTANRAVYLDDAGVVRWRSSAPANRVVLSLTAEAEGLRPANITVQMVRGKAPAAIPPAR